jgi:hypothetical protein
MTKLEIQELLATNDRAVCRAVVAIYKRQTAAEKGAKHTLKANGVGFNSADSRFLSLEASKLLVGGYMPNQAHVDAMRNCIMKYSGQLLEIAAAHEAERNLQQLLQSTTTL